MCPPPDAPGPTRSAGALSRYPALRCPTSLVLAPACAQWQAACKLCRVLTPPSVPIASRAPSPALLIRNTVQACPDAPAPAPDALPTPAPPAPGTPPQPLPPPSPPRAPRHQPAGRPGQPAQRGAPQRRHAHGAGPRGAGAHTHLVPGGAGGARGGGAASREGAPGYRCRTLG